MAMAPEPKRAMSKKAQTPINVRETIAADQTRVILLMKTGGDDVEQERRCGR